MVSLFQCTLADLHNIGKVSANLRKKPLSDGSFSEEQSVKRIGVVCGLFGKSLETL